MQAYDIEKMKQKVVYPTEQTPSYADWRLFEMGVELEKKVDSGGGSVIVDDELSTTSENPVQNKIITTEINSQDTRITVIETKLLSTETLVFTLDDDTVVTKTFYVVPNQ